MATHDSVPPTPATLGRFRVVRRLGAGGMAEVFLAKSLGAEGIEKVLVVKRVLPTFSRSPKFLAMFVDEAKLAMRLNHPNIVQVYAFEQVKDEFLLAMEYVDGMDLGRLLSAARRREKRLPASLAALLALEVAKGLDYAHNRKDDSGLPMEIVHRDVSPQNVLLSYDGAVKVADFGIARARMISEETGVIKGKFGYMSPEQARGQRVDRRSDVYAVGVMLAELLMGRAMYPGLVGMEVLDEVREGRVTSPRSVERSVPPELDAIVMRALAADREERFQTCRSLAGALSRWLHQEDEAHDLGELERFIAEVAPRQDTSPEAGTDGPRVALAAQATVLSVPHAGPARAKEKRHVVALAGNFRDPASTQAGDEGTRDLPIEQAMRVLSEIAFKYGALLERPPRAPGAPSFTALFGMGRASVDDPLHAARFALDVIEALHGLSADALRPMTASIGLSRGVVTARSGDRRPRGEHANDLLAVSRDLAQSAAPNEVLCSGEVYRLARRAFSFATDDVQVAITTPDGPRTMRGWRLVNARGASDRTRADEALMAQIGLVGRANEVQALVETWGEVVRTGTGTWIVLVGELGVGKTALAAAAISRLAPAPRLVRLECPFGSSDVPHAAVSELVRDALGLETPVSRTELERGVLRLGIPEGKRASLVDALAPIYGIESSAEGDVGAGHAERLTAAVRTVLGALTRHAPVVVWVDAVQFMDPPSRELMARLVEGELRAPILVVFTTRPDERVESALRGALRIEVKELAPAEAARLVEARFGAGVPPELTSAITQRAGGSPFFVLELCDALLEKGIVHIEDAPEGRRVVRKPGVPLAMPSSLEDVIAARIAELGESERALLRWLAVFGSGLREHELAELSGVDATSALRTLQQRGLVELRGGGEIAFQSIVVRHVAYEGTDAEGRARLHRRVGAFLAASPGRVPPARLARHHELAGEPELAARAWRAAGESARAAYSNREALRFFARAIALMPQESVERFALHESREQILRALSLRTEQRTELETMRRTAETARNDSMLATAMNRLARHDLDAGRLTGVDAMLRRALDAAIGAGERASEIEALRLLGHLRRDQGDVEGALHAFERALGRAGIDAEHLAARGMVLVNRSSLLWRQGRLDGATEDAAEGLAIFRGLGMKGLAAFALNSLGISLSSGGRFEDAIACVRASIALDREAGDRMHLGRKASNVGQLYAELGDVDRAIEFLERALVVFEYVDDPPSQADTLAALAEVRLEQAADPAGAETALDDAERIASRLGDRSDLAHARLVRSELERSRGRLDAAASVAKEAAADARAAGTVAYEVLALSRAAAALADVGARAEALEAAERATQLLQARGPLERHERVELSLAHAFRALGDDARAEQAHVRARAIVTARERSIRDDELRLRYVEHPVARAALAERQS